MGQPLNEVAPGPGVYGVAGARLLLEEDLGVPGDTGAEIRWEGQGLVQ